MLQWRHVPRILLESGGHAIKVTYPHGEKAALPGVEDAEDIFYQVGLCSLPLGAKVTSRRRSSHETSCQPSSLVPYSKRPCDAFVVIISDLLEN